MKEFGKKIIRNEEEYQEARKSVLEKYLHLADYIPKTWEEYKKENQKPMTKKIDKALKNFVKPVANGSIKSITISSGGSECKIDKEGADAVLGRSQIGHNSGVNSETADRLRGYIEGIENYEAEKKEISERMKEVFDEAKSAGFDVKTIRKIIKIRKADQDKLLEEQYLLETYCEALQMDFFK